MKKDRLYCKICGKGTEYHVQMKFLSEKIANKRVDYVGEKTICNVCDNEIASPISDKNNSKALQKAYE